MKGGEKMKRTILLLFIISILTIVGCDKEVLIADTSSYIAGVVVDSISQQTIDSVAVFLSDTTLNTSFYSDSLGLFKYVIFGDGVHRVFFQKEGYDTKFKDFNFSGNPTDIRIELVKQ